MGAERRAGLGACNLRTLSTPNIVLDRKRFETSDLAGRRGSGWNPQLGPRYAASQRRRPATVAGDAFGGRSMSRRHTSGAELLRRSSASRPSTRAGDSTSAIKPPDVTTQEAVLLRSLQRIKELRSGKDKMAGIQWTPRGQHVLPRRKVEEEEEEEEIDFAAQMRELHERTKRLEDVVDDKIARREAWLDLWNDELHGIGWVRPEKIGRRALHGATAGAYVDTPAMPRIEVRGHGSLHRPPGLVLRRALHLLCALRAETHADNCLCDIYQQHDGRWRRGTHQTARPAEDARAHSTPTAVVDERPQTSTSVASASSTARRHPQHKTVGRRANSGLSVPYRSGRYQAVVQHRHAYTQALRGVTEVDHAKRREKMRLEQANSSPYAVFLVDAKLDIAGAADG